MFVNKHSPNCALGHFKGNRVFFLVNIKYSPLFTYMYYISYKKMSLFLLQRLGHFNSEKCGSNNLIFVGYQFFAEGPVYEF